MTRRQKHRGRPVNGILLLDKPLGISSNNALQQVKRLFNASKAGHTGNLDPLATGMLPICLGEATKLSYYLLDADKVYIGTCKLGVRTSTADAEGEVIETRPVGVISEAKVREVLESFNGEITQIPPMHSALKHQGQPLYKLAHQGIEVERKPRQVQIQELTLLRFAGDELEIRVHCSKGTYIRTLAEDIGEALGCGAHLSALRRTEVGATPARATCTPAPSTGPSRGLRPSNASVTASARRRGRGSTRSCSICTGMAATAWAGTPTTNPNSAAIRSSPRSRWAQHAASA